MFHLPTRRTIRFCISLTVSVAFLSASVVNARAADASAVTAALERINSDDLLAHVNVLASDTLEGREAGSRGGKAAGVYIVEQLKKHGAAPAGEDGSFFQPFGNGYRNILVAFPGSDETLKDEYIVVGAHYDHVGYGNRTNSLGPIGRIHNGADDNASGTAGLLEVIDAFTSLAERPKRSVLFVFWDAEEKGLLGSEHWIRHPTVPLENVSLSVNTDMIGRMRGQNVEIYGIRTAAGLRRLVSEQNTNPDLKLVFNWTQERNSDHFPFYGRRIPYVMLHTRKHADYHRPSDDIDKLNVPGMEQLTRLLFGIVHAAAEKPEVAAFRSQSTREGEAARAQSSRPLPATPPRLGASWDATRSADEGVIELTGVTPGSPASRSELRVGDRIFTFGPFAIDGTIDFRTIVMSSENPIAVVVERDGEADGVSLSIELDGEPRHVGISWRVDSAEPTCVILTRVDPGSPAWNAGLRPNDRMHSVDGTSFGSSREFHSLVTSRQDGFDAVAETDGHIRAVRVELPVAKPSVGRQEPKP